MKKIHIGEEIEIKLKEVGMPVTEFARAINCSRSSVYNMFKSRDISIKLLIRISKVLDYDFIKKLY